MQNHLPKVAILKTVLKSFTNFTGKNLWWSPFLVKLQSATLLKKNCMTLLQLLTLFRIGLLGAAWRWEGLKSPAPLKSVTHILQWWNLTQRRSKKYVNHVTHVTHKFFEFLKIVLINMVAIWMMSSKMVTLRLLKIKVLWNKVYDV